MSEDAIKRDYIRVKAIGLIRRNDQLLLEEVREPDGPLIGYRPLGGSIEFGEKSWEALEREFMEELGEDIKITKLYTVLENIFTWDNKPAHEVIFVYEASLLNKDTYQEQIVERMDSITGNMRQAYWVNPHALPEGVKLLPTTLMDHLDKPMDWSPSRDCCH